MFSATSCAAGPFQGRPAGSHTALSRHVLHLCVCRGAYRHTVAVATRMGRGSVMSSACVYMAHLQIPLELCISLPRKLRKLLSSRHCEGSRTPSMDVSSGVWMSKVYLSPAVVSGFAFAGSPRRGRCDRCWRLPRQGHASWQTLTGWAGLARCPGQQPASQQPCKSSTMLQFQCCHLLQYTAVSWCSLCNKPKRLEVQPCVEGRRVSLV